MKLGVSLSEKRNKNENETHWIMKMNTSARQVHTELPERISGVSQNENQTHPKMEMNTRVHAKYGLANTGFEQ
jgi:hypothetical protein